MPTLRDIVDRHTDMGEADREWLRRLTADWQIVADLAFADLVLWLPTGDGEYVACAQCRPGTGPTIHYTDVVGTDARSGQTAQFDRVRELGIIKKDRALSWDADFDIGEEIVPVVRRGRVLAILTRQVNLASNRTPSRLEINYIEVADELIGMISRGEFPSPSQPGGPSRHSPRVGDGLLRLNAEGDVLYASPNALSVFHRIGLFGEMVGSGLAELLEDRIGDSTGDKDTVMSVAQGRVPWLTQADVQGTAIALRAVPLTVRGIRTGALILVRDISELRRRELELMTKDATIREIHHRVKNNLQTVAALLRLQARRSPAPEVRTALLEAQRRVATIATVHDMLSQTLDETVNFDEAFGRNLRLAADAASAGISVRTLREGGFGKVSAQDATLLAIVLTELVTNAVEHGLAPKGGGTVWIQADREGPHLTVTVSDDGVGLDGTDPSATEGLGTQIVRTFVTGELRGSIKWRPRPGGGTQAIVEANLR
ncbi:MAG: sensor histidine kinase [Bifidobacteriaceae bacterium]|nr:sensor histidine kinase [Bifidobacteriaceae bacterium]